MSIEKEILDSIAILIKKYAESNTQIYIGTVTNLNGNKCSMLLNGKVLESVRVYGATPPVGAILPVFVPSGNFNVAFTMYMQESGSSSTGGAEIPVATRTTLGEVKPIAKTSDMTQTVGLDSSGRLYTTHGGGSRSGSVASVNGQTGTVVLEPSDIGALPDTTVVPTNTSQLTNDSGFLTSAPVTSVNSKTGAVTLTQDNVGDGSTYVRTHNDFTDALKAQISTNATNISSKQAKITASGILKGDGNGGVSAAISGADYAAANLLVVSNNQPTSQPTGGVWYKLGKVLS